MSSSAATTPTSPTSRAALRTAGDPGATARGAPADSSRRASFDYKAKRFVRAAGLPPLERHHAWKEIFSEARAALLGRTTRRGKDERSPVSPGSDPLSVSRCRSRRFAARAVRRTEGAEPLARLQDVDLGIYLVDDLLVKTDAPRWRTRSSPRPLSRPARGGFRPGTSHPAQGQRPAQEAAAAQGRRAAPPRRIVYGRKRGFSIPAAAWLRGELEPFARDVLAAETLRRHAFFESSAVTRLLDRHVAGEEDLSRQALGPPGLHAVVRAPRGAGSGPAESHDSRPPSLDRSLSRSGASLEEASEQRAAQCTAHGQALLAKHPAASGVRLRSPLRRAGGVAGQARPTAWTGYLGTDLRRKLVAAVLAGEKTATAGLAEQERSPTSLERATCSMTMRTSRSRSSR